MLNSWEEQFPGRLDVLFKSITNIAPSHLADNELFDFKNLEAEREQSKLAQQSGNDLLNTVNLF